MRLLGLVAVVLGLTLLPLAQQIHNPPVYFGGPMGPGGPYPRLHAGTIDLKSDADYHMVFPDTAAAVIRVTSAVPLSQTRNIINVDNTIGFEYIVQNVTQGGKDIIFKGPTGTGVTVPNGSAMLIAADGTNYVGVSSISATAISDLLPPSASKTINFGQYLFGLNFNPNTSPAGSYLFSVGETVVGTSPPPNNRELMSITTRLGSTTAPLGVYTGSGFWLFDSVTQQLQARGGAKFAGPVVLTTAGNPGTPVADAPALGTDASGNIVPKSGAPGPTTPVYSRPWTFSIPTTANYFNGGFPECIPASSNCTMATPSVDTTYRFSWQVSMITAGSGGTCNAGTISFFFNYTDADSGAYANFVGLGRTQNVGTPAGQMTFINNPPPNIYYSYPLEFRAKHDTNVNYRFITNTASNCDTPPVVVFRPLLFVVFTQ